MIFVFSQVHESILRISKNSQHLIHKHTFINTQKLYLTQFILQRLIKQVLQLILISLAGTAFSATGSLTIKLSVHLFLKYNCKITIVFTQIARILGFNHMFIMNNYAYVNFMHVFIQKIAYFH